jgi:uncharacterized SAM-binding protein YcdF (DUF218 family)
MVIGPRTKWLVRLGRTLLALAALWIGGFLWFTANLPLAPAESTATDGIVVLTGGTDRMKVALDLLEQGIGRRLLISGVNENITDEHLARVLGFSSRTDNADRDNLFNCCVDTGRQAADTAGNAQELADWAADQNFTHIRVVTGAYHMPRALVEIRRLAPSLTLIAHPVFPDNVKIDRWWAYRGTTGVLATAFNKYVVALVRLRLFGNGGDTG